MLGTKLLTDVDIVVMQMIGELNGEQENGRREN